jgi:hypothetical protein
MPWQPTVTPAAPLAHASSPHSYPPSRSWLPHALLGIYAQTHAAGVSASDSQSYLHSYQSLDSVAEMVARAVGATVLNVVGMISTEAGLSVEAAEKCNGASPRSMVCRQATNLFLSLSSFCYHQSARQLQGRYTAHPRGVHISPWRAMPRLTLRWPCGVYSTFPLCNTLAVQKPSSNSTVPTRPYYAT